MIIASRTRLMHALGLGLMLAAGPRLAACAQEDTEPALSREQQAAVAAAKRALNAANTRAAAGYTVRSVEARQWRDSSLGCPQPNAFYLQVITTGYAVLLEAEGQVHEVHVAGNNAVVCPGGLSEAAPRRSSSAPVRVTNLKEMEGLASEDLARRLGVARADIRVTGRVASQWTLAGFECVGGAPGESTAEPSISGFRLQLRYQGRIYTYHTDLRRVLPCPPIESR